jgi:hypothetical protein
MEIEIRPVTKDIRFAIQDSLGLLQGTSIEAIPQGGELSTEKFGRYINIKHLWWIISLSALAGLGLCSLYYKRRREKK